RIRAFLPEPSKARDQGLLDYADSVLTLIEKSGGTIGKKKPIGRSLMSERPAREWAAGERKIILGWLVVAGTKRDVVEKLTHAYAGLGPSWHIRTDNQQPVPLLEWLKEHHPPTRTALEK